MARKVILTCLRCLHYVECKVNGVQENNIVRGKKANDFYTE